MSDGRKAEKPRLPDEIRDLDKRGGGGGWLFDFGHPLVNRIADSFLKAAAIGAVQAASREAYNFIAVEGEDTPGVSESPGIKRSNRFSGLKGENSKKSLEDMVKCAGKESFQWGLAAGVYSGLTYGLREVRGTHDWKNSAVAGAITGAVVALAADDTSQRHVVQCAITGAAITAAAKLLCSIF